MAICVATSSSLAARQKLPGHSLAAVTCVAINMVVWSHVCPSEPYKYVSFAAEGIGRSPLLFNPYCHYNQAQWLHCAS